MYSNRFVNREMTLKLFIYLLSVYTFVFQTRRTKKNSETDVDEHTYAAEYRKTVAMVAENAPIIIIIIIIIIAS